MRGGLLVGAGSPRVRAAFHALVHNPACTAYRDKAKGELQKHEAMQRIEELARRRAEQAAEAASAARLVAAFAGDGNEAAESAAVGRWREQSGRSALARRG